jgi:hypothetical protein
LIGRLHLEEVVAQLKEIVIQLEGEVVEWEQASSRVKTL